jgi:hypothetical protein
MLRGRSHQPSHVNPWRLSGDSIPIVTSLCGQAGAVKREWEPRWPFLAALHNNIPWVKITLLNQFVLVKAAAPSANDSRRVIDFFTI